jgi:serine/threonine protein kinase
VNSCPGGATPIYGFAVYQAYGEMPRALSVTIGTKLGPYEITAPIGAGGMSEVYRARDLKLKRDVALKVLPEAFASDVGRMLST